MQGIEACVQHPPPGVFGPRDLRWDLEYRPPRGGHKKLHVVQQYYKPMIRVDDFIEGMQCGPEGAQCKFRPNKENMGPNQSRDGHRTALNFVRSVFHCHSKFSGLYDSIFTVTMFGTSIRIVGKSQLMPYQSMLSVHAMGIRVTIFSKVYLVCSCRYRVEVELAPVQMTQH